MLRAPLSTKNLSNTEYSSSESLTPIVRMRGIRTAIASSISEIAVGMMDDPGNPVGA
jgi:hypothetical protein